jgi:hypothetical protein
MNTAKVNARNLVVAYHVCLFGENANEVIAEQFRLFVRLGLYKVCSKIYIGISTLNKPTRENAKLWIPNFWNYGNKIDEKVEIVFYEDNENETQTLNWIRTYAENNVEDYIMYFHSSGVNNLPVIINL